MVNKFTLLQISRRGDERYWYPSLYAHNVIILQSAWFYADIPEEIDCFLKPFRNKSV